MNLIHLLSISWDLLTVAVGPGLSMSDSILSFPKCAVTLKKPFILTLRWTTCQIVRVAGVTDFAAHA